MKLFRIRGLLGLLTALAVSVFFAGCGTAYVPVPAAPDLPYQEKTQAVGHWRSFAEDMADKVRFALLERHDLVGKPLHVQAPSASPFLRILRDLLKTEIVSRGISVTEMPEPGSVLINYDVTLVRHDQAAPGDYYEARHFPDSSAVSRHEAVVNIWMQHENRYVLHLSYVRYINDADWMLYAWPETAVTEDAAWGTAAGQPAAAGWTALGQPVVAGWTATGQPVVVRPGVLFADPGHERDVWARHSRRGMAYAKPAEARSAADAAAGKKQ